MKYESDTFRFIIICIFFVIWLIISIIPGLGIIGDLLFRAVVPGVPVVNPFAAVGNYIMSFFSTKGWWPWEWSIWEILIDLIPIIGPIINFTGFMKKGYF